MEFHLFNRLGQFSASRLPFERVDSTVGGTIDSSVSGSKGVPVAERAGPKCGCDAGRWRLRWTVSRGEWSKTKTHVILSSSSSVGPATFSLVSTSSRGCECGYLRSFGAFGGIVIVRMFAVGTRTYVKNRRGGELFVVEAFTEVWQRRTWRRRTKPFSSAERHAGWQVCNRQSSSVADSWTSAQRGCETELECRRSLPGERVGQGQSRRWCGRGKSELLEGASPNGSELRGVTTEHDV